MRYALPHRLAHTEWQDPALGNHEPQIFLRKVPGGPSLVLVGVGALIWRTAARGSADVSAAVAAEVGRSVDSIRAEVDSFLRVLADDGLLAASE